MNQSIARPLLVVVLVATVAGFTAVAFAREAVVTTKAGQTYTGELVSDGPDAVVMMISGIRTSIPRDTIDKVELKKTPEEEYAERRAQIADDDYQGRYNLALDLYNNKAYKLSIQELDSIKATFSDRDMTEVDRLLSIVQNQLKLQQQAGTAPPRPQGTTDKPAPGRPTAGDVPLLTPEQISTIRLWELPADLAAARPRVIVPNDVIDDLFAKYGSDERVPKGRVDQQRFRAMQGWEQLDLIFSIKARDLYARVIVNEDPAAIIEFRRTINPIFVVGYFRPTFEGKVEGLNLKLAARDPNAIPEVYTNFLILSQAQFNGKRFIDRDVPRESLLIQWALPRDAAVSPAPEVENWRPFFRTIDDPRVQTYIDWIDSLYKRPEYNITYPPKPQAEAPAADAPKTPQGRGQ